MRHKTLAKHGEDWPTGCSTPATALVRALSRWPNKRITSRRGSGARPAKLLESIGWQMQIRAGHFVTPAAQGNGLALALGQSLIDANAYCV